MSKPLPLVLALLLAIPFFSFSAPTPSGEGNSAAKDKHITAPVTVTPAFSFVKQGPCMPITVKFTDNTVASAPDVIVSWLWNFDDGSTSTLQNPSHVFTVVRTYNVQLTVTNNLGTTYSITNAVVMPNAFRATIPLPTDTFKCATASIVLDAGVPATSYSWVGPVSDITRSIIADFGGTYDLTVDSNGCQTFFTVNVNDLAPVTAGFSYLNQSCTPVIVAFSDLSSSCASTVNSWDWDFGDGTPHSTIQNPVHTYLTAGLYNVKLVVTDMGAATSVPYTGSVVAGTPIVNLGPDSTICSDGLTLDAGSNGQVTYLWSTGATGQYIHPTTVGTYWARANNNGCIASDTMKILGVRPSVKADFSHAITLSCAPIHVTFTDLTQICNDIEYERTWNFGDGATLTETYGVTYPGPLPATASHNYAVRGTYNVKLTVMNSFGTVDQITYPVIINDGTVNLGNDTAVCPGTVLTLNAGAGGASYSWSTGATTQTISVSTPGKYWVNMSNGACPGTDTIIISHKKSILPKFGYQLQGTCLPIPVQFTDSSLTTCGNTITQWNWDFADGNTSVQQNPLHSFAAQGTYNVRLILTDNLGIKDTAIIAVVIPNAVQPTVNLGVDTTICSGAILVLNGGTPATAYTWSTGATTQTINVSAAGTYWVQTNNNGCIKKDTIVIATIPAVTADYSYTQTSCISAGVTFTDLSSSCSGIVNTWQWDFGDGGTSTLQNPVHPYSSAGSYLVKLNIKDNNGNTTQVSKTVVVTNSATVTANFGAALQGSCLPVPVKFTDSSTTSCTNTIVSWNWNFGDGNTSTLQHPVHAYAAVGPYTVKLSTTDNYGTTDTKTMTVTVTGGVLPVVNLGSDTAVCASSGLTMNAGNSGASYLWSTGATTQTINASVAGTYWVRVNNSGCIASDTLVITGVTPAITTDFTYTGTAVSCLPAVVNFTDISQSCAGAVNSWQWNFGDGGSSTLQHPSHAYITAGTYTVTLLAKNSGGYSQSKSHVITVSGSAPVNLGSDLAICEGTSATLDAGTGSAYAWNTGAATQTISVNVAGTYIVNVTNGGCSSKDTIVVSVTSAITPNYTFTVQPACLPIPVKFNDASVATCTNTLVVWYWDFRDGYTSTQRNPLHSFSNPGTYQVILKVTDNRGVVKADTQSVVVTSIPVIVNLGKDTTVCAGSSLQLDAANTGATYLWSTGATTQKILVAVNGTYNVTVTSGTCKKSDTIVVKFVPAATPDFGYNITSNCLPVLVKFTDSTIVNCSAPIVSWDWKFGDGSSSAQQHPQHTYLAAGTFAVKLTVTAADGTVFAKSKNIIIINAPLNVNLGADITTCVGTGVILDAGNTGATYKWTPASSLSSDTARNPVANPAIATLYKVTVTRCTLTAQDSIIVYVDSVKRPVITQTGNKLGSTYAATYQWYQDGQLIHGANERTYKPRSKGYYTVKVSNGQGCEATSAPKFFVPSSDLDLNIGNKCHVKVSPNPGHGHIHVYLDKFPESKVLVTVFDRYGKRLFTLTDMSQAIKLNMTPYPSGIYFVVVIIGKDLTAVPLIVE